MFFTVAGPRRFHAPEWWNVSHGVVAYGSVSHATPPSQHPEYRRCKYCDEVNTYWPTWLTYPFGRVVVVVVDDDVDVLVDVLDEDEDEVVELDDELVDVTPPVRVGALPASIDSPFVVWNTHSK